MWVGNVACFSILTSTFCAGLVLWLWWCLLTTWGSLRDDLQGAWCCTPSLLSNRWCRGVCAQVKTFWSRRSSSFCLCSFLYIAASFPRTSPTTFVALIPITLKRKCTFTHHTSGSGVTWLHDHSSHCSCTLLHLSFSLSLHFGTKKR